MVLMVVLKINSVRRARSQLSDVNQHHSLLMFFNNNECCLLNHVSEGFCRIASEALTYCYEMMTTCQ